MIVKCILSFFDKKIGAKSFTLVVSYRKFAVNNQEMTKIIKILVNIKGRVPSKNEILDLLT